MTKHRDEKSCPALEPTKSFINPVFTISTATTPPPFGLPLLAAPSISTMVALVARCCARVARASSTASVVKASALPAARRWNSTAPTDPKIATIVDQISQLTLLQTAELVSSLKVCKKKKKKHPHGVRRGALPRLMRFSYPARPG